MQPFLLESDDSPDAAYHNVRASQDDDMRPRLRTRTSIPFDQPIQLIQRSTSRMRREPSISLWRTIHVIVSTSWTNLLLFALPFAMISYYCEWSATATFTLNFLVMIPLAGLLGFATEQISVRAGDTLGGLLNASFGNATELILSIAALNKGLLNVVQASLLGSILSNLLFVLGFCFFFGGLKFREQKFSVQGAQTQGSLLALSVLSLLVPAAFVSVFEDKADPTEGLIGLSEATSAILLLTYVCSLVFQLKTHAYMFEDEKADDDEEEEAEVGLWAAIVLLLLVTVVVALCAEMLVDALETTARTWHLSETFIGLILLPIVGNAAEHFTAVTMARKDKMNIALGVAIGSSIQIALFVCPLLVLVGAAIGQHLTLFFHAFQTALLFISVLIVNYIIVDGSSNWLEGVMLLNSYAIIAVAFFYYPDQLAN